MMRKKPQTPQELYKARKQREEEERRALLPPGMINHGNTCFMNTTLQGLFATPLLHELIRMGEIPRYWQDASGSPILLRRSPLLTNGHRLGGQDERGWVEGMPLGDIFIVIMQKAWTAQAVRRRESISPKEILVTIGRKYDQYLGFQQQDAHEFLRHLLDAMRMEEVDIIKKRQPPPPPNSKRHRLHRNSTIKAFTSPPSPALDDSNSGSSTQLSPAPLQGEEKLESFVDMVFGGKLASILVCEKCKKVSLTYEDFNDLSLSIKPEDYARERKRDRIKQLAKKFRFRPHSAKELSVSVPMYRSSSVPPSPSRRSNDVENNGPESPENADPRRKSFEHVREDSGKSSEEEAKAPVRPSEETDGGFVKLKTSPEGEERDISEGTTRAAEVNGVEFDTRIGRPHEKVEVEQKKEKEDPWGKLGRRISVSMRMGKKEKRSSHSTERGIAHLTDGGSSPSAPPTPRKVKSSAGVDSGPDAAEASDTSRSRNISPSIVLSPSPLATPPIAINSSFPALRRSTTEPPRAKSPRPPKPSREEAAYLRRILADVHTSSPSTLALLQQALSGAATTVPPMTAQSLLSKLSHLPGIEECMRMFTSVEIMDGDNMVGCHRCWKIANGTYKPKHHEEGCEDEDGEEQLEDVERGQDRDVEENPVEINVVVQSGENSTPDSSPDLGKISPAMTTFSLVPSQPPSSIFIPDNASVSSAPTTLQSIPPTVKLVTPTLVPAPSLPLPVPPGSPTAHVTTFGGLPIPSISTTGPESPSSDPPSSLNEATADNDSIDASPRDSFSASLSNDSLLTPLPPRKSRSTEGKGLNTPGDSSESSDGEYGSSASDASGSVSPYSDTSPGVSPTASPHTSLEKLRSTLTSPKPLRPDFNRSHTVHPTPAPKVPKSQQVIMRRTYKRYLIATPPPVLVVHLKRFQQISRMYAMSFSTGFKKLDEFVAFPEYLDVTPFLAPKREDFGLDKKQKGKKSKEKNANGKVKEEKCMYRLYAVVVHIGNMLGGHYVAYTALPQGGTPPPSPPPTPPAPPETNTPPPSAGPSTPPPTAQPDVTEKSEITKQPRQWAYVSDQIVRLTTTEEVLKAKAYICMYERI